MSASAFSELSARLRLSLRDLSPTFSSDANDRGQEILLVTVRNPLQPHWGITYEAGVDRDGRITGALWFGQCEITGLLPGDEAEAAIRAIVGGEIAVVVRYRTETDWEDRRPSGWQRIFRLLPGGEDGGSPDSADSAAFDALSDRLHSKPGFLDRLAGNRLGVFEIARWSSVEIVRRGIREKH